MTGTSDTNGQINGVAEEYISSIDGGPKIVQVAMMASLIPQLTDALDALGQRAVRIGMEREDDLEWWTIVPKNVEVTTGAES